MRRASQWLAGLLLCLPGAAGADDLDRKLTAYENEARLIGTNLPQPHQQTGAAGQRRLIDAEVAYSLGDYDTAALMLFDLSSKSGPDQETALYYLGESLYQKGDKGAARTYFAQIAGSPNVTGKYYQPSLLRLIEIAIAQRDNSEIDKNIASLDAVPAGSRLPEVPYVRGKYAFSQDKHDDALRYFAEVPKGSSHDYQAAYYTATTLVAKRDLARATEVFTELIGRKPRTANDRRVIELAQLALGRLYYERDQPSKAIDAYLLVDRRSDLFPDALYEVAWVYVKGKQFDKALRALELLNLSEPTSTKTPTVRILEGNLRIRKAQLIRQKQIAGTLDANESGDPATEYDRAAKVFNDTHDMYVPSYEALKLMADSAADPAQYLAQIAGRSPSVFQATAPLPEAAAQYLREEPDVQRVVSVESDLADIESNIEQSEAIIARLEGVLAVKDRTAVYPALQSRRGRIGQIQDDLNKLRNDLAEQQLRLVDSTGELAGLSATRKTLAQQYAALPNAEQAYADLVASTQAQYDAVDQSTADVAATLGSTQAVAVALRKYVVDTTAAGTPVPDDQKRAVSETLDAAAKEAQAIEDELAEVQREIVRGRDLAGVGDETVTRSREVRKQLKGALDAEHRVLAGLASASRDRGTSQKLAGLGDRAQRLSDTLALTDGQIDTLVDQGTQHVQLALVAERANIVAYKSELDGYETESRSIGGTVLGASFRDVKAKFYDVVIRTDVGSVDVRWSQKEDADDDLKRLNLSRQRDLKQLQDEFKGIIDGGADKPKAPPPPPQADPLPAAGGPPPSGSPDKGATGTRVKPGGDAGAPPAAPTVRPDTSGGAAPGSPRDQTSGGAAPGSPRDQKGGTQPRGGGAPKGTAPKGGAR